MKIKIAILEQDKNYLQRLISAFEIKYEDKVESIPLRMRNLHLRQSGAIR